MTNTVLVLCQVAKEAGYLRLFACIAIDNEKSIRVVQKAHFVQDGEMVRNRSTAAQNLAFRTKPVVQFAT